MIKVLVIIGRIRGTFMVGYSLTQNGDLEKVVRDIACKLLLLLATITEMSGLLAGRASLLRLLP